MEPEKKRAKSSPKQSLQKYLFPITIISSILISGSVGYTASQIAINNSSSDSDTMKNQVTEAKNDSVKVIETEIPKIISNLEKYNQDINLIDKNIKLLKENLALIKDSKGIIDKAITFIGVVNTLPNVPFAEKYGTEIKFAKIKLDEIENTLIHMENLTVIKKEMSDSHQQLNLLYEEYQKEKSIEQLLLIEQELNSNLIYQIEDLKNITREAQEVFELSSSILTTVNNAKSFINSMQETGGTTLDVIQFWKDNEEDSEDETNTRENFQKVLAASEEEIQNLPDELAQQSIDSITSISIVQKELQTIRIAQMIIGE
jgi:hypothetical protein